MIRMLLLIFFTSILLTILSVKAQTPPVKQWDKTYGADGRENFTSIRQTTDGGYILGGYSPSYNTNDKSQPPFNITTTAQDYWVVKVDANGVKQWDKTIGGIADDYLYCIQQTSDGGYILGGYSGSGISGVKTTPGKGGGWDYWIVKLSANGNQLWDATFGGIANDYLYDVRQTTDGGYILAGNSFSNISGDKTQANKGQGLDADYWIVKVDSNGVKQWDKSFGGTNIEYLKKVIQTPDGGYILGGESQSGIGGDKSQASMGWYDYWIVKIDANGNKLWDKTYGGNMMEGLFDIIQTSDGGYIMTGNSESGINGDKTQASRGSYDYWVVKINSSGVKQWDKSFGTNQLEASYSIKQTSDNGYIIGGLSLGGINGDKSETNRGVSDYWIVKLNSSGQKLWDKSIGGNDSDNFRDMDKTSDGGFILGGFSYSAVSGDKAAPNKGTGISNYWVVKMIPNCSALTASITDSCTSGGAVTVNVNGIQTNSTGLPAWTLNYKINGVSQTVIGSSSSLVLAQNAALGTVFKLISISSGPCITNLSDSLQIQAVPVTPTVLPVSRCGSGVVSVLASGAPTSGSYLLYNTPIGGIPLTTSTTGILITPIISNTSIYYAAIVNGNGCEGPRSAVTATVNPLPIANAGNNITVCSNDSAFQLTGFSPNGGIWSGTGVSNAGVFTPDPSIIGNHTLTYTVTQNNCSALDSIQVTVIAPPLQPTISLIIPDTLISSVVGKSYEWKHNNNLIPGNTQKLKAIASGIYSVRVNDVNNCASVFSANYTYTVSGLKDNLQHNFSIYPNPSSGLMTLELQIVQPDQSAEVIIFNALGQEILKKTVAKTDEKAQLDLSKAAKGIYLVQVKTYKQVLVKKIIVE